MTTSPEDDDNRRRDTTEDDKKGQGIGRKIQFRWNKLRDLTLAKEVEAELPFTADKKNMIQHWKNVANVVNATYPEAQLDYLGVRRRFELILGKFKSIDAKQRNKSGVEEEFDDLDKILTRLLELSEAADAELKEATAARQKKLDENKVIGDEIRDAALSTMVVKRKADDSPAPAKRATDSALIELFEKKDKTEKEFKMKELDHKEKQLDFEKEKFEHQKQKERDELQLQKDRFDIEKQERTAQLATQKIMLELLMKKM